ncbi:4-diphosphocytidyl-2-C-methyl-D-erythritol kinase [Filimonas lacunae]|uniref:4-diphosphocytidyl-2-C-methyl-D-erythritol kinase n=1 Tax=Filimonas lacunae TaxID=477680 RepID=A0A173MAU4_9BACT|nr:4-(cytidine 5'-diphospho)-2-C-methyl-D-erythritol kinase [Filimonas lacunae]BAV04629.1 4-diphosphocytidyl-2-C-methyl-D-erythritol kinase [Filimonas lacunae]SIT32585.1 4-diphosphocytidyl-2-C-methyl-D-erythritol kinase [Filimonas lacunae]
MVHFPNCKINLGLNILRKRTDGFHDLETVFYPLPLQDALEIQPSRAPASSKVTFTASGLPVDGSPDNNLCVKAYHLLLSDFPHLPAVNMHLHKTIPMGAGLGGGSADGAFALRMLNQQFQLGLSQQQLIHYALQLGSDCPFFIINTPCWAAGRGEQLQPVSLSLKNYKLVVINPGIHVHTGKAFSLITPAVPPVSIQTIVQQPVHTWRNMLTNDFEAAVFQLHPEIAQIKEQLYQAGAVYASMTGTGSTVFGLFEQTQVPHLSIPAHYFFAELQES